MFQEGGAGAVLRSPPPGPHPAPDVGKVLRKDLRNYEELTEGLAQPRADTLQAFVEKLIKQLTGKVADTSLGRIKMLRSRKLSAEAQTRALSAVLRLSVWGFFHAPLAVPPSKYQNLTNVSPTHLPQPCPALC